MSSTVQTTLTFFLPPPDGSRAHIYTDETPPGQPRQNWINDPREVSVEDVRASGREKEFNLDVNGFQFFKQPANYATFENDEQIKKEYYPESEEFIKKITGARKIVLFDHTIRRRNTIPDANPSARQPVSTVHGDQTPAAARARVERHLPESEAAAILSSGTRFQIINLWRPIQNPADEWPLALADWQTIDREKDLVPVALLRQGGEGQNFGVKYNPETKWKYVKGMTPEECVLIKCYDSIEDGSVAVMTAHTAFNDPTTPEGSPARQSIELRALVIY